MSEITWATDEEKTARFEDEISAEWDEWFNSLPIVCDCGSVGPHSCPLD